MRSLWLVKKPYRSVALQLIPNQNDNRVDFQIIVKQHDGWVDQGDQNSKIESPKFDGTVKRGSVTCPLCGYTTPVTIVREQLKARSGGSNEALLLAVVTEQVGNNTRQYRLATASDKDAIRLAAKEIARRSVEHEGSLSLVPEEKISLNEIRRISVPIYGMRSWGDLWTTRQKLVNSTLSRLVREIGNSYPIEDIDFGKAVQTCLTMVANKLADYNSSLCTWHYQNREKVRNTFARQAIPMVWDYVEVAPFATGSGNWAGLLDWTLQALNGQPNFVTGGHAELASATAHPLPTDSVHALITDPPYYDAIPYSHLSDFFYVLFRRSLLDKYPELFSDEQSPKSSEIVVDRPHQLSNSLHDITYYERELERAFAECRRILRPDGIGTIVFASKTTASWEAILNAVVDSGLVITGSWPIDTEMESRVSAQGQARLASSVHLVCRPREDASGAVRSDEVGEWRDVLTELPKRIHDWMPRLAEEGVVGADAIFACLGPALEIFSRYSRVEKASGEPVPLKEYLEQVWAAVSKEALGMIFQDADASGLEEDARLTVLWFWVLKAARNGETEPTEIDEETSSDEDEDDEREVARKSKTGYALEYDAARKLAQGLGADLFALGRPGGILKISGNLSSLYRVSQREEYLFGKQSSLFEDVPVARAKQTRNPSLKIKSIQQRQGELFDREQPPAIDSDQPFLPGLQPTVDHPPLMDHLRSRGRSTLDRLHQAMLLFGRAQSAHLGPFLLDTGMASNDRFWKLAQSLSALYPPGTEEKRWVDGVLARKKGLGF